MEVAGSNPAISTTINIITVSSFLDKLKELSGYNDSVEPPKTIQHNFFSHNELTDIKTKILNLQNYWEYLSKPDEKHVSVQMLPAGLYSRSYEEYSRNIEHKRSLMWHNFSSYYEKIKQAVEQNFQVSAEFIESAQFPGFHIFVLDNKTTGSYPYYNFHRDRFEIPKITLAKIYSFIIPISLPSDQGALLYTLQSRIKNRVDLERNTVYNTFTYCEGSLAQWPGNLIHTINPFTLKSDESRITLQFHVSLSAKQALIFW